MSEQTPGPGQIRCPYCEEVISAEAKKCRFCGEWIQPQPSAPAPQPPAPPAGPNVTVNVQRPDSVAFAVVTLLCLIFVWPIGVILNIVGLLTGPRRGCFLALFFVFIVLPVGALVAVVVIFGWPEIQRFLEDLRQARSAGA